jgi:hypothetical protein
MPTWSERYGGPMRDDQVEDVTMFVLNWESEELCAEPEFVYEWPELAEDFLALDEIEEGDPGRGAELYDVTYACIAVTATWMILPRRRLVPGWAIWLKLVATV